MVTTLLDYYIAKRAAIELNKRASVHLEARMAGGRNEPLLKAEREAARVLGTEAKRVGGLGSPRRQTKYVRDAMQGYGGGLDTPATQIASKGIGYLTDIEIPPEALGAAKNYLKRVGRCLRTGKD